MYGCTNQSLQCWGTGSVRQECARHGRCYHASQGFQIIESDLSWWRAQPGNIYGRSSRQRLLLGDIDGAGPDSEISKRAEGLSLYRHDYYSSIKGAPACAKARCKVPEEPDAIRPESPGQPIHCMNVMLPTRSGLCSSGCPLQGSQAGTKTTVDLLLA